MSAICLVRKITGAILDVDRYERVGDSFQLRKRWIICDFEVQREVSEDGLESEHGNDLGVLRSIKQLVSITMVIQQDLPRLCIRQPFPS